MAKPLAIDILNAIVLEHNSQIKINLRYTLFIILKPNHIISAHNTLRLPCAFPDFKHILLAPIRNGVEAVKFRIRNRYIISSLGIRDPPEFQIFSIHSSQLHIDIAMSITA